MENDQDNWRANTITASSDGYRFYFDPSEVTDTEIVKKDSLRSALDELDNQTK